jgi:predicted alpha/beta-hydrolase family hydrolase
VTIVTIGFAVTETNLRHGVQMDRRKIEVEPGIGIASVWAFPEGATGECPALILAHGAGSNMEHPFLSFIQETLTQHGIITVKFNFPYVEAGRKVPDHPKRLVRTWRAVIERVRTEVQPSALFLGGRSMGGRIASMVAADGEQVSGLVLLGYPLHPAGRLDALRAEHLAHITCPMLFVQGTRDQLCDLDTLRSVLARLSTPVALQLIEQGDHSFKVPKRTGKTAPEIWEEIGGCIGSWLTRVAPAAGCAGID